jgi:hypothetical protein
MPVIFAHCGRFSQLTCRYTTFEMASIRRLEQLGFAITQTPKDYKEEVA